MTYTAAEKIAEIENEIAMRLRHYPVMIARGGMSSETAARKINILREVAKDYRDREFAGIDAVGSKSASQIT